MSTAHSRHVALEAIRQAWEALPDLRLGQLIENCNMTDDVPTYYMEDDDLVRSLDEYRKVWAVAPAKGVES